MFGLEFGNDVVSWKPCVSTTNPRIQLSYQ